MMKILLSIPVLLVSFSACNDSDKKETKEKDTRIALRADSINTVWLSDTMVIYESICRGCAYEGSTRFNISDSMDIVKLLDVITHDESSPDMQGGIVGKELELIALKPGTTSVRLYKLLSEQTAKEDSARFTTYTIEVKQ